MSWFTRENKIIKAYKVEARTLDTLPIFLIFGPFLTCGQAQKCLVALAGRSNIKEAVIVLVGDTVLGDKK